LLPGDPLRAEVFSSNLPPSRSYQALWEWLLSAAIILFLLDVAARRLASPLAFSVYAELTLLAVMCGMLSTTGATWGAYLGALVLAEIFGWAIRWPYLIALVQSLVYPVTALARVEERAGQSLAQLRGTRRRVREDMDSRSRPRRGHPPSTAEPHDPPAEPATRFDMGEVPDDQPAEDLNEALQGAPRREADASSSPDRNESVEEPPEPDDRLSRLHKIKRRLRDEDR